MQMMNNRTFKVCLERKLLENKLADIGPSWLPEYCPDGEAFENSGLQFETFLQIAQKSTRRSPDKALVLFLMDQSKTSGIGNYILSEVSMSLIP